MANIVEGLTKTQVKQIIKIAKGKILTGRTQLQGLLYQADCKTLFVTDGFVAVLWDMSVVMDNVLPKEDVRISYQNLNAWCANASAKDILRWDSLFAMAKPEQVPDMHGLIDKFNCTEELPAPYLNPAVMSLILPLFLEPVELQVCSQYKNTTSALKLIMDESKYAVKYNQTGIIMGMKK